MTQPTTSKSTATGGVAQVAERVKVNVKQVLVGKGQGQGQGQGQVIEMCLAAIMSGGHILIEDVPGIGKTTLVRSLADSLNCTFT